MFPDKVKLEPLLQHSRAVSAYDSTLILAHSLTEESINTSRIESQLVSINYCSHKNSYYSWCIFQQIMLFAKSLYILTSLIALRAL